MCSTSCVAELNITRSLQVTDVFKLSEYQQALDKYKSRAVGKIAVRP